MNTCNICNRYTRPNTDYCLACRKDGNVSVSNRYSKEYFEERPVNFVKGHIGEALIQNLFSCQGFVVLKYGMENNLSFLSEYLTKDDFSKIELAAIRNRPDLMVLNPDKRKLYLIEVKYTASGHIKLEEFDKEYPYDNCYLLAISKTGFRCVKVKEFKKFKRKEAIIKDKYKLELNEEFGLDKGLIGLFQNNAKSIYKAISDLN